MSESPSADERSVWLPDPGAAASAQRESRAPAAAPPPQPAGRLTRTVAVPAWLLAAGVAALVAAVAGCAVLIAGDGDDTPSRPAGPRTAGTAGPQTIERPLRDPFDVDRVRWAVFLDPAQRWTAFADDNPAGAGHRWVLLAVRLHNLGRPAFVPADQPIELSDAAGRVYAPDFLHSNAPAKTPVVRPDARGQLELAYRVPAGVTRLRLRFTAGPRTRVVVPFTAR